ncbi:MAG: hypothetical protein ACYC9L_15360 [Sulfuricaulis sp.]
MDHNNNDTDTIPAAHCCARHSLTPVSLHILARRVARQSLRALVGLLAFGWLFLGIHPVVTSTGISWQLPQAIAGSVLYVNDAAGRLAAVIDPTSNAAVYHYDAVGNILSINQYPATQVSIITVNPNNSTGSQAQVCGTGFSSTLSQNTVSFNGVTSTILSVSGACLIVAVPANATTGTVTLTTPSGSTTSGAPYVITPAPTISGFTPTIGDPGTTVTVFGSTLNPIVGATKVELGNTHVDPISVGNSQISFPVPSNAGSGPIQVITPFGQAVSTTDFIVPPSAIGAANVVSYAMLTVNGGAQSLNINAPNKYGIFVFNATAGQLLSLQLTSLTTTLSGGAVNYQIYSPSNVQIMSGSVAAGSNMSIFLPVIPTTGAYLIVFGSGSGTAQLSATLATASAGSTAILTINGGAQALNFDASNNQGVFAFNANVGQLLTLQLTSLFTSPSGVVVNYQIYSPSNVQIKSGSVASSNMSIFLPVIPTTGNYLVKFGSGIGMVQLSATLETAPPVPLNGGTLAIATTAPAQSKRLSFTATAGQNLGLGLTGFTFSPTTVTYAYATVYKPDGSYLLSTYCFAADNGCKLNLATLPQSGTYSVVIEPMGNATMSFKATLTVDVTSSLVANTPYTLNLAQPGQEGLLSFTATAGQYLAIAVGGISTAPASNYVSLLVYKPDGTLLTNSDTDTGTTFNLTNLAAGTYTLRVIPYYAATATMQVKLAGGATSTVTTGGGTISLGTTAAGQYGYVSFNATAGQNLGLGLTGFTFAPTAVFYAIATVYKPDGSYLWSTYCFAADNGCNFNLTTLPQSGIYSVVIQPGGNATMSFKATLTADVASSLVANTPYTLNLAQPGQEGLLSFTATAGQYLAIAVGGISTTPVNNNVQLYVYKLDGTTVLSAAGSTTGYTANLTNLAAGTYTLHLIPDYAATATIQVKLVGGATSTVTTGGGTLSLSTTAAGQYGYVSFNATAGQNLGLGLTGFTFTPMAVYYAYATVYKPDGSYLTATYCYASQNGCDFNLATLPQSGTYSVVVQPMVGGNATMSFNATLTAHVTTSLVTNTPYTLNLAQPGQEGLLSFSATAGQYVAIAVGGINTTPSGNAEWIYIYKPDGTSLTSAYTTSGYTLNLTNLVAGTYTVSIVPDYAATATMQVTLVSPQDGDLNGDGIVNVADVALAERMALGLVTPTANQLLHGDVAPAGGNGTIDTADVARIRRKALGLENF